MESENVNKILTLWASENKILNPVKKELYLDIIDQIASLFSAGSYYYYIINFENLKMEFVNDGTKEVLGISPKEFSVEKLFEIMHPDDLSKLHDKENTAIQFLLKKIPTEDIPLYKVVYLFRLKNSNGTYKTILHQTKTLTLSEGGKIQQVIGIHTDVTHLNIPFNHKISFISSKRTSYYSIDTGGLLKLEKSSYKDRFSKRELEVIKKISEGKDFHEIARQLYISPHTINTHKRNILRKSECKNSVQLITKCIIEGVI